MKKVLSVFLTIFLVLTLVGCANGTNIEKTAKTSGAVTFDNFVTTDAPDEGSFTAKEIKLLKSKDKCSKYMRDVRKAGFFYLGLQFPWFYNMGCMKQESNCRADVVSFDGGIGLYQFTPSTGIVAEIKKDLGIPFDPFRPDHSAKAQAYYISKLIKSTKTPSKTIGKKKYPISPKKYTDKCGLNLADVYQRYNGGDWFYYEAQKADSCDREEIEKACSRGGAWVGSGKNKRWLSFCDVNYKYPHQIYTYSQLYKTFDSPVWRYWLQ